MDAIFIFLTNGFEEIEAIGTVDVLRRAGLDARTVSLTASKTVTGSHGVTVTADGMFGEADFSQARMLVLPGGTPKINDHEGLRQLVAGFASQGGLIAAICAAPMVLGTLGLLEGRRATCYPGFEHYLKGAILSSDAVVVDGNITTGRGPGMALDFALAIVEQIAGKTTAKRVAEGMLVG